MAYEILGCPDTRKLALEPFSEVHGKTVDARSPCAAIPKSNFDISFIVSGFEALNAKQLKQVIKQYDLKHCIYQNYIRERYL
mgnify:FL=1